MAHICFAWQIGLVSRVQTGISVSIMLTLKYLVKCGLAAAGITAEELASMDPKRAKRLIANRQVGFQLYQRYSDLRVCNAT